MDAEAVFFDVEVVGRHDEESMEEDGRRVDLENVRYGSVRGESHDHVDDLWEQRVFFRRRRRQ